MKKIAIVLCLVGYVVCQDYPSMPFMREGCDLQSIQQCAQPFIASSLTKMQNPSIENFDMICREVEAMKSCIEPKMESCGPEAVEFARGVFAATNYMCYEARNETMKYVNCMRENFDPTQFTPCLNHFMNAQRTLMVSVRLHSDNMNQLKAEICSALMNYEVCLENAVDRICHEGAYLRHVYQLLNSGLSFLNCDRIKTDKHKEAPLMNDMVTPGIPPEQQEFICAGEHVRGCLGGLESKMASLMEMGGRMPDVDQMCRDYYNSESCLKTYPVACRSKARILDTHLRQTVNYLCVDKRAALKRNLGCMMRELPRVATQCINPISAMETRGDFLMEQGRLSPHLRKLFCRVEGEVESCLSNKAERVCGSEAKDLLEGLYNNYNMMAELSMGFMCWNHERSTTPELMIDYFPEPEYHHHHRKVLMIVLPIAGIVVIAILVAIAVAVARRHRRPHSGPSRDKAELVKNDLLQQNLRFAITQTPKEKEADGLKV